MIKSDKSLKTSRRNVGIVTGSLRSWSVLTVIKSAEQPYFSAHRRDVQGKRKLLALSCASNTETANKEKMYAILASPRNILLSLSKTPIQPTQAQLIFHVLAIFPTVKSSTCFRWKRSFKCPSEGLWYILTMSLRIPPKFLAYENVWQDTSK